MKAEELRIGNLVNFNDTIATVLELRENHARIEYMRSDTGMRYSTLVEYGRLEGVLITEEWLVKFGFKHKKTDKANCYTLNFFSLNFVNDGRYKGKTFIRVANFNPDINNFLFIHQLQNLYFALTGQELTPSNHDPQS